jgi:hypothetical protein
MGRAEIGCAALAISGASKTDRDAPDGGRISVTTARLADIHALLILMVVWWAGGILL